MPDPSQKPKTFGKKKAIMFFLLGFIGGTIVTGGNPLLGLLIGIVLPIVVYRRMRADNRLKKWCQANGWVWIGGGSPFLRKGGGELEASLKDSRLFWKRYEGWEHVIVFDSDEVTAALGEIYHDTNPGQDDNTTKTAGFMLLRYEGNCPGTTLEPHHLTDFLPKLDGRGRVEFESDAFNQRWRVHSEDPKAAFDRFDQSTLEFLEQCDLKPTIEFAGNLLILKADDRKLYDDDYREKLIAWVEGFSRAVPDDLLKPLALIRK